jgi:hypothetical protein
MKVDLKILLPVLAVAAIGGVPAVFFAGSTAQADWKEYENPDYSFAISFPVDPTLEATTFRTADGRSLEAHTFSVEQKAGVFMVTVVEMPGEQAGEDAPLVKDAAKIAAEGGAIKFDIPHSVRAVYGRQLGIVGANGGYSYVALFYHKQRLYRIEGKAWRVGRQSLMPCASTNRSISSDPHRGVCRRGPTRTLLDSCKSEIVVRTEAIRVPSHATLRNRSRARSSGRSRIIRCGKLDDCRFSYLIISKINQCECEDLG